MIFVGTAGWNVPRAVAAAFPAEGAHLERYAQRMQCVEIDTSFYREHRFETYARWALETPPAFRFAVKLPRSSTHERKLRRARAPLEAFLAQVAGLGAKLGVLLVQLPPSLEFEARVAHRFFALMNELHADHTSAIVCEPRHPSWFTASADRLLAAYRIGRVAADPIPRSVARSSDHEAAARPGGWLGLDARGTGATIYYRWHGSPRVYWSAYSPDWLEHQAACMRAWSLAADCWCIFDNTAAGAALDNALAFDAMRKAHDSMCE
ncbi:MAG: DUF72 domain-containing protein [Burkholderiaceae bacterium]